MVILDDGMGEFRVNKSSLRQRFLEAFRVRSEIAASMDDQMRSEMAERLKEEYGSPRATADAIWMLARENGWLREGEHAERYLSMRPIAPIQNQVAFDLEIAWHGAPIGNLSHNGFEWRWKPLKSTTIPLVRETVPGKLPPFIESLLPEGWLEKVLAGKGARDLLRHGRRYMSNITTSEKNSDNTEFPNDILGLPLSYCTNNGVFTGKYEGPANGGLDNSEFERNLARIYGRPGTPRLSGVQIKLPMHLDPQGRLSPATDKPFTHILKPAGTGAFDALPIVEWMALTLGQESGLEAPSRALVKMPEGMPIALLVERFDIRKNNEDNRMIAMEDMCSVLDVPSDEKYEGTLERVVRAIRSLSTEPEKDATLILKRGLFAWLIGDGDLHLKNLALLKTALPGENHFESVRIAPLYDAVTTKVFPNLKHDQMAFKLNGKGSRLRRVDFLGFAATAGIRISLASEAIDELKERLIAAIERFELPPGLEYSETVKQLVEQSLALAKAQAESF
jgi:serine/threonine-protein kinase HipA